MHEIVFKAQEEFYLFKEKQLTLPKEDIIKHAQQLAVYEHLLSEIKSTGWYEMIEDHNDYDIFQGTDSLLKDMYHLILTEKLEFFNPSLYPQVVKMLYLS